MKDRVLHVWQQSVKTKAAWAAHRGSIPTGIVTIPLCSHSIASKTPLLIGQGEKDGRLIGSDAVFVGLQRLGKKVEYRIYENEGHVIARKANVLDFWKRRIEFLDEYLDITIDDRGQMIRRGRTRERPATNQQVRYRCTACPSPVWAH